MKPSVMKILFPAVALSIVVLLAACGKSSPTSTPDPSVPKPAGDLYQPPDPLPHGEPGALIWAEEVALPTDPPATIWRMLYHSRNRAGGDVAVSGFAIVPKAKAPADGRSVYAWGHGTVGLGDQCAPSKPKNIGDSFPPYGGKVALEGGVVVATDYEGLGTPGTPPFGGVSEGQSVLDSARAVKSLPNVGAISDVILAGHSQGGRAALFAGELAAIYAPELQIKGVVALAPGAELATLIEAQQRSLVIGGLLIGAISVNAAHPEVKLEAFLTPAALADVARVTSECVDTTVERWRGSEAGAIFTSDLLKSPELKRIFDENSPGASDPMVPMLIVHGTTDAQVPVDISATLASRYCALGTKVTRRVYPNVDHDGIIDAALKDVLAWMTERFEGKAGTSTCT